MIRILLTAVVFCMGSAVNGASPPDFTDLIKSSSPAVVKINVVTRAQRGTSPFGDQQVPEPFREFFERFNQGGVPESSGVGSGFVISDDGYVVTNAHVVEGADEIRVRLIDRREFDASIIGLDQRSDLAVLKIDADELPVVEFANPDGLDVGDWVVAIGSPFDLDYSASAGIVSAIGRSLPTQTGENYVPFIQTDVAINPGNSGGPLFNLNGEVVGINSQIFTRSGGYMGLSFAIPVNVAEEVISQLLDKGTVSRGWLGVLIQEVTPDLAESFSLDKPIGALVSQVVRGSPADSAGLRAGDIILELDSRDIEESSDLPHVVGLIRPGKEVDASVMREGALRTIQIRIGELSDNGARSVPGIGDRPQPSTEPNYFGLTVRELDSSAVDSSGADSGVVVDRVEPDSPADRAGLTEGDVIVQIGFSTVENVDDLRRIAADVRAGSVVPIRFFRNGNPVFRTLQVQ